MRKKVNLLIIISLVLTSLLVGCQSKQEKKKQINQQLTAFTAGINNQQPQKIKSTLQNRLLIYDHHKLIIRSPEDFSQNFAPLIKCSGFNTFTNLNKLKLKTKFKDKTFSFAGQKTTVNTTLQLTAKVHSQTISWTSKLKITFANQQKNWYITKIEFI